jgi:Interferon-induced 6-16 family
MVLNKSLNLQTMRFRSNTPFHLSRTLFRGRTRRLDIMASPASPEKPKPDHKATDPVLIALKRLQVAGAVVAVGALLTLRVLGLVGFSAIGPVAGSLAAGWQSSMGAVSAGSLFAWCQSAATGGAAATAVTATGIGGGIAAAGATVSRYLRRKGTREADTPRSEDKDDDHDGHENDKGRDDDEGHDDNEGRDDDKGGKGNEKN